MESDFRTTEVVSICSGVEAAGERVEEKEDVTGDGVDDGVDCSWTGVDEGIALDVVGGALEEGVGEVKENGVELEDIVKGVGVAEDIVR